MQSFRRLLLASIAAALAAWCVPLAPPLAAQAAVNSPCHVSLLGTVTAVRSADQFTIQTGSRVIDVHSRGARLNANGLALRPGVFAGVYGCYGSTEREFNASQVTLAASQAAYTDRDSDRDTAGTADIGACHVSLFGTITSLRGQNGFVLQPQRGSMGSVLVDYRSARINANGLTIRPGVFAGLYGCVERDGQTFKPNEVTLATSAAAYGRANRTVTLSGTIDEVNRGWIGVRSRYTGHIHVYTAQTGFRTGERVEVRGAYDPMTGIVRNATVTAI